MVFVVCNVECSAYSECVFDVSNILLVQFLLCSQLIAYLELSPTFALVTKTLTKSAKMVAGFAVVFFILLLSFAFMFMVSFSTVLAQYSTATRSCISLLRALLGDIDYRELR